MPEIVDVEAPATMQTYDHTSGKIWSIYVAEADKYDKALIEGWGDDMDATLIFVSDLSLS
jgi:hypothetical protein